MAAPLSKHSYKCFDVSISQICRKRAGEIQLLFPTNPTITIRTQSLNIQMQKIIFLNAFFMTDLKYTAPQSNNEMFTNHRSVKETVIRLVILTCMVCKWPESMKPIS